MLFLLKRFNSHYVSHVGNDVVLLPGNRNLDEIWKDVTQSTKYTVVIFEETKSYLGREVGVVKSLISPHLYKSFYFGCEGSIFNALPPSPT